MTDTIHVNGAGRAKLNSLVDAGKVDSGEWKAPNGGDSSNYLAVDTSHPGTAEAHYKYPFSADGSTVNKKALASIESYATTNGEPDVAAAAHEALAKIDGKAKKMADDVADTSGKLNNVEIFSVGRWRGSKTVEATPAMLDEIVSNFHSLNAKVPGYGVPVKLGHTNIVGAPAYGWMSDVERVGDVLVADFVDMDPTIVDAIGKHRYNSVSVELYPAIQHAGKTFENVLGGVALLGAEWPAVKGLKPLSAANFAEAGEKIELSKESEVTFTEEQMNAEKAKFTALEASVADLTAKLAAADAKAAEGVAALAAAAEATEKSEIAAVIKAAEDKGQIVPANKPQIEAFAESVRTGSTPEARKGLLATFKGFVESLPVKASFTEQGKSKAEGVEAAGDKVADVVDAKVKAHLAANKGLTYEQGMNAVFAADPELKTRYAQE